MRRETGCQRGHLVGLVVCAVSFLFGCTEDDGTDAEGSFMGNAATVTVYGFEGCPNTPEMLGRVREACESDKRYAVEYVDVAALEEKDTRRGWPAPSVVVDGEDLFGMPRPSSAGMRCRHYPGGLPGVEDIRSAIDRVGGV